jgi:hypothetical protein
MTVEVSIAAILGFEKTANKGIANGYEGLDSNAKVPIADLAILPMLYSDSRIKLVTLTRDISLTTDLAITGAGFPPKGFIIFASIQNTNLASWAMGDSSAGYNVFTPTVAGVAGSYGVWNGTTVVTFVTGNGIYNLGALKSADTDGITLSWIKNGSPTGTATLMVMFFR